MMLGCVGILSLNGSSKPNVGETGVDQRYYAFLSVACGLISPLALSIKHIFIRFYKSGYNTWDMAIDGLILEYSIYIMLAVYYILILGSFSIYDMLMGCLASVFLMSGKIAIAMAIAEGLAGPATSLTNTQTIHATILTTLVSQQSLNYYEMGGIICGITGATIISTGDMIIKKIR